MTDFRYSTVHDIPGVLLKEVVGGYCIGTFLSSGLISSELLFLVLDLLFE